MPERPPIKWGNFTVKADRRLNGWVPGFMRCREGTTAELISAEKKVWTDGPFKQVYLSATFKVMTPGFGQDEMTIPLHEVGWKHLDGIDKLAGYLEACADTSREGVPFEGWRDQLEQCALDPTVVLQAKGGPKLRAVRYLQALDLVDDWRDLDKGDNVPAAKVRQMLDWAYSVGRDVREAEVPGDLQRARAYENAQRKAEAAKAWQEECAVWAQSIVDSWPSGTRLNNAQLGKVLWSQWESRPFADHSEPVRRGPAEAVDQRRFEQVLIPLWRDTKALRFP